MARFITRRLLLSLLTLWLIATIVFFIANVLPNDVGRTILGPFAPQESVDALNERLGTNRPLIERYVESIVGVFTLDFGNSFVTGQAVMPTLAGAIGRSAKLAGPGPDHHDPRRDRRRPVGGAPAGPGRRSRRGHPRPDVIVDPRIRDRHDPDRGASVCSSSCCRSSRGRRPTPTC